MILEEFALLASDTARTKAYLQAMVREEKLPGICIVYSDHISRMKEEAENYKEDGQERKYFDVDVPVLYTVYKARIPYMLLDTGDINSEWMENTIQGLEQKYLIYSGYGGSILKPHLFRLGKRFIHVHAGILPQYRGSTTIYYSFLQEKNFGATALFLNEGIDEGEIILEGHYEIPGEKTDIDYIYEPYIRSRMLIKTIEKYLENGRLEGRRQSIDGAETYFIIHPVLKHLALLGIEQVQKKKE